MAKRWLFLALIWISIYNSIYAQNEFSSEHLKETAINIGLSHLDTLKCGDNMVVLGKDTIIVRKNEDGVIDHIGKQLFPIMAREKNPLPVYDYMEYVYLNYLLNKDGNKLLFKDVAFIKGGWKELASVTSTDQCNISNIDNKAFQIEWKNDEKALVSVLIPIRYDVLSNMSRTEMQNAFIQGEKKTTVKLSDEQMSQDTTKLTKTLVGDTEILYYKGKSYLNEKITNNYYLVRNDSLLTPITDKDMPMESIANIMVLPSSKQIGNYKAKIRYLLSNNKTVEQTTTIRQIIDYAMKQGCKPYFGLEGIKDGVINFSLFLYNENSGYDHIFRLSCKTEEIGTDALTFTGRGSLYAPTTNVKSLYSDGDKKSNVTFKLNSK